MNAMAPTRLSELHRWRIPLTSGPAAAAEARKQVRAAIWAWDVCVDPSVAVLLTSELVTNVITHAGGETFMLAISCTHGRLRVDVHDTSSALPVVVEAAADAETGRGLMLVATLAAEWGFYRTLAGKAVYFALESASASESEPVGHGGRDSRERTGVETVNRELSSGDSPSPLDAARVPTARSA